MSVSYKKDKINPLLSGCCILVIFWQLQVEPRVISMLRLQCSLILVQEVPSTCRWNIRVKVRFIVCVVLGKFWVRNSRTCDLALSWWRSIVVRPPVQAGELSLSWARLMAGRVTTLWIKRPLSVNQHGQLSLPSLRGRLNDGDLTAAGCRGRWSGRCAQPVCSGCGLWADRPGGSVQWRERIRGV